jgi:hypothetical protein
MASVPPPIAERTRNWIVMRTRSGTATLGEIVALNSGMRSRKNGAETGFQCLSARMTGRMIQAQQRSCYAVFLFNMSGGRRPTLPHFRGAVSKTRS